MEETLDKADLFLSNQYLHRTVWACSGTDIVNGIIEAEKYGLNRTLKLLIDYASRNKFAHISEAKDFGAISKEILFKISMSRWQNDIH